MSVKIDLSGDEIIVEVRFNAAAFVALYGAENSSEGTLHAQACHKAQAELGKSATAATQDDAALEAEIVKKSQEVVELKAARPIGDMAAKVIAEREAKKAAEEKAKADAIALEAEAPVVR